MEWLAWARPAALGVIVGSAVLLLLRRDAFRSLLGFYLLSAAINLLVFWSAAWDGDRPPILQEGRGEVPVDPLVQALVLTAIVITLGTTALFGGTLLWSSRARGTLRLERLNRLRG